MKTRNTPRKGIIDLAVIGEGGHTSLVTRKPQSAEIHGPLAIFRVQFGWNITHIRTGLRVIEVIGNKSLALQIVAILLEGDWNFGEFGGQGMLRVQPESTRQAMKKACEVLYPKVDEL